MTADVLERTRVYVKTPLGQTEIQSRALRLTPRLRAALILIDGRRTDADIAALAGQEAESSIERLMELGCIEIALPTVVPVAPAQPRPAVAAVAAAPVKIEAVQVVQADHAAELLQLPPAESRSAKQVEMARNFMTNTINTMFGQNMRLSLVRSFFECRTAEELRGVYPSWAEAMAGDRSAAKRLPDLRKKLFDVL